MMIAVAALSVMLVVYAWLRHGKVVRVLRRRAHDAEARVTALFERTGISMWDEDWKVVGEAIRRLKQSGVDDIQGYYASRPEEARDLRRSVVIRNVNAFTVEMMGVADKGALIGTLDRILPDTDQTFVQWLIAFGRSDTYYRSEAHIRRPDGSTLDCVFSAELPVEPAGFGSIVITCMDVTGFKAAQGRLLALETELSHALRVSTMGALTASIAHEVNSPLAAIISNAEAAIRWLERDVPDLHEARAAARSVVTDAVQAREVVARTRSFLSNAPRKLTAVDMVDAVQTGIRLVERELRGLGTSVHFDSDPAPLPVSADPIHMQQVIVNLVLNAAQAMGRVDGPRDLTVTVRRVMAQAHVEVRDLGEGIAPDDLERVFEPFFSTKAGGMGMGLAICRTFIEMYGGRITVQGVHDGGTAFRFFLPLQAAT